MQLRFRDPKFVAAAKFGGRWAAAGGLTTSQSSATGFPSIDVTAVESGRRFQGVKVDVPIQLLADSGQTLTVGLKVQHSSASGGSYADLGDTGYVTSAIQNITTATGAKTQGLASISRSLVGAKKFVKVAARRIGSAADTGSDIDAATVTVNFFGGSESPATA